MEKLVLAKPWGAHREGAAVLCDHARAKALRAGGFVVDENTEPAAELELATPVARREGEVSEPAVLPPKRKKRLKAKLNGGEGG